MDKYAKPNNAMPPERKLADCRINSKENTTDPPDLRLAGDCKQEHEYIQYLADIVESSDDAIISKSLEGIIKSWNKGGEKMFGYTASQAVGKHISLIIPRELIQEEKNIVEKIRNNETINHYETVGSTFYFTLLNRLF